MCVKKLMMLASVLILSCLLVACGASGTGNGGDTTVGNPSAPSGETPSGDVTTGGASSEETSGEDSTVETDDIEKGLYDLIAVDETVYVAVNSTYYRSAPDVYAENIAGRATEGETFNRVRYNADWSAVLIDGVKYYLPTECLSVTVPEETASAFETVDETVFVTESDTTLRTAPVFSEAAFHSFVDSGEALRRVGYSEEWSIVVYNGLELYIPSNQVSESEDSDKDINFSAVDTKVYVTAETANLYDIASDDEAIAELVVTLSKGQALDAVGISEDGTWYQVEYFHPSTGKKLVFYVKASAVSETAP